MIDFTHADIERLWNSVVHYVPERQKLDMAIDFIKSLENSRLVDFCLEFYSVPTMVVFFSLILGRCCII